MRKMTQPVKAAAIALFLMACGCGVGYAQAASVSESSPVRVALVEGTCATVSPGDFVTLDWNPAFDRPAAVNGLRNFRLGFSGPEEAVAATRSRPAFFLELAAPYRLSPPLQSSVSSPVNGLYSFSFEAVLPHVRPGIYHLTRAEAVAVTAPDDAGPAPQMTNDPARSYLCLNVVGTSRSGRRGKVAPVTREKAAQDQP